LTSSCPVRCPDGRHIVINGHRLPRGPLAERRNG